jgi:hypothetical protein
LELPEYLNMNRGDKTVMFTNYGNSGVVNKNAARVFALEPNQLLPEGGRLIAHRNSVCRKASKTYMARWHSISTPPEERPRAG